MKALYKKEAKPGIWMKTDASIPGVGPNDVLIKIKKTAICGTDIHIYNWDQWSQKNVPVGLITGHEYVGVIEKTGSEVTGFKPGDRVSGEGHITCRTCRNCRSGKKHLCIEQKGVGVNRQGAFAEYLSLPSRNTVKIPDDINDDFATIFDPFGNATHAALSFDLVGEDILITGAGPIGIMAVAICKFAGARNVVITDVNDYRLGLAKKMGATRAVNVTKETLREVMSDLKMTEGFDVGLEMSGNPAAFHQMIDTMRASGKIAQLGIPPGEMSIDWSQLIFKGLTLKGIYGREVFETWHKMIAMVQSGLNLKPVITHHFPIDDFQKAFETMASGQSGKVILDWVR
ncbi:MAG: L-threonine 3-dehydrogenase [Proteobacteria bacterium]|nr:L-threonine 3-dehydrogenase [Pseudomonadota bacterium]